MVTLPVHHKKKAVAQPKKKTNKTVRTLKPRLVLSAKKIAAGEFKAKCLAILDEVNRTGQEVIVTKRGKAVAKLVPFQEMSVDSLFGRLKGIVKIVGDPDDLVKPIIPLEDWESLR
jgi:prevent-host-death family protein